MPRGTARELWLCALFASIVAVLQWFPMLRDLEATGFGDWQMIHHNWEAAYVTLSRFGEWPLWDPFHCGGVPILGNPESQLYSPWFLLSFAFGTVVGVKLMLLGQVACGAAGMYWLARRRYQLLPAAAGVAAVAFACSGCFVWDGAGGHATFLSFAFAPWLSYWIHRRGEQRHSIAAVALLLLLTLLSGGTYPLPFFVIWTVFELIVRAFERRSALASVRIAAFSYGLLAISGAIRFIPIFLTLQAHPRKVSNTDVLSLSDVWTMLTARTHAWRFPGHKFVWPEYGSYMGIGVVVLAALGLALALRHKRWHWLAGLALYASLMLGNLGPLAPFSLLHRLPVYDSLRVPSRFAVFVTFYLALLAAYGVDSILRSLSRPRLAAVVGGLAVVGVLVDMLTASWSTVSLWREAPLSSEPPAQHFHLVRRDYYRNYASYPRLNLGTPTCYVGGMNWPVSKKLWLGAKPQLRLVQGTGKIQRWDKTPNGFRAAVSLETPARIVFDQNFARGFESNVGTVVEDHGLLALDLPPGDHALAVRYRPPELAPSALLSCLGALLILWLLRPSRARP